MKSRAIISVHNKNGLTELANALTEHGYELVSTGGTASMLREAGFAVTPVEAITGFPECLDGRVKTLHPRIFAGLLAKQDNETHRRTLEDFDIAPVAVVVSNLYPFANTIAKHDCTLADAVENIDIGGPSLVRAAAKNYPSVTILTDPSQYAEYIERLRDGRADEAYRFQLAAEAFNHTAAYDARIATYLRAKQMETSDHDGEYPDKLTMTFEKQSSLRYGENPHQSAAFYKRTDIDAHGVETARFLHGKELSFNNIGDAQGAIALTKEFDETVCVAVKHASPCGVGTGANVFEAFMRAYECDPTSIFGGIICFNRTVDAQTAAKMKELFLEVIIAPAYDEDALRILQKKKNLRLLEMPAITHRSPRVKEIKSTGGGLLIQQSDATDINTETCTVVTKTTPTDAQMKDLLFGMKVVRHVKSNAIVVAKDGMTLGIGGGQVSRIWAAEAAINHARQPLTGAVMASDAFFPLPDVVEACAKAGITAIIQPGGSINDAASVEACDRLGIAMICTGVRHFKH